MHPIARRFSPAARAEVRRAFTDRVNGQRADVGYLVEYQGRMCCPLGVALIADNRVRPRHGGDFVPDASQVALALSGSTRIMYETYRKEANQFIGPFTETPEQAIEAFSEEDVDAPDS